MSDARDAWTSMLFGGSTSSLLSGSGSAPLGGSVSRGGVVAAGTSALMGRFRAKGRKLQVVPRLAGQLIFRDWLTDQSISRRD
jgi:hypothetical protein